MYVVGLISGTSADGIDTALIEISGVPESPAAHLVAGQTYPYDAELQRRIWAICSGESLTLEALAVLDDTIAHAFAQAAKAIQVGQPAAQLVGSHGQTVYHRPLRPLTVSAPSGQSNPPSYSLAYSLQLGRGDEIARLTELPTVANFRRADIALGGEGAPLVPAIDAVLLRHPSLRRCIQNIGGIGNLTYLPPSSSPEPVRGWDTGPGNSLLDLAVQTLSGGQQYYDANGAWAAMGSPCQPLLSQWLSHPFFEQPPPKSTGRELFGDDFLQQCIADAQAHDLSPEDLLATLTELTASSISLAYRHLPQQPDQVLLCGGGRHNRYLVDRIRYHLQPISVVTTEVADLSPDYKEAIAFGILAYWRWHNIPSNLPAVTGASRPVSLGEVYLPPQWSYDRVSTSMPPAVLTPTQD